jgi:hypothetical protein
MNYYYIYIDNYNNMSDSEDNYDSDFSEDSAEISYEPEEAGLTRFVIILCELYNERMHGTATTDVLHHYLVYSRYKSLNMKYITETIDTIQSFTNFNFIKPQIGECIYLSSGHCVAIVKTIWIKLIQRTWKNIIKEREKIIRLRSNPNSLKHRELTGRWPIECSHYPLLTGMLYKIK